MVVGSEFLITGQDNNAVNPNPDKTQTFAIFMVPSSSYSSGAIFMIHCIGIPQILFALYPKQDLRSYIPKLNKMYGDL